MAIESKFIFEIAKWLFAFIVHNRNLQEISKYNITKNLKGKHNFQL